MANIDRSTTLLYTNSCAHVLKAEQKGSSLHLPSSFSPSLQWPLGWFGRELVQISVLLNLMSFTET